MPRGDWLVAAAVAAIVLAPYATLRLPFRVALEAQAAAILAVVLALLATGLVSAGWRRRMGAVPGTIVAGLLAYVLAALLGAVVGLARGNDPRLLAGQLLAMGLLPLGAAAGLILPGPPSWRGLVCGVTSAAGAAATFHLALGIDLALRGRELYRLMLPNSVAPIGSSALAIVLLAALVGHVGRRLRWAGGVAIGLMGVFAVVTEVRSMWLTLILGMTIIRVRQRGWRALFTRTVRIWGAAAIGLAVVSALGVEAWWRLPRPNLLPDPGSASAPHLDSLSVPVPPLPPSRRFTWAAGTAPEALQLTRFFPVNGGCGYRLRALTATSGGGKGSVAVVWIGADGGYLGMLATSVPPRFGGPTIVSAGRAPARAVRAYLRVDWLPGATGTCSMEDVTLVELRPAPLISLHEVEREFLSRLASMLPIEHPADDLAHLSIAYRAEETRVLVDLFAASDWVARLFGQGLGARYHLGAIAVEEMGSEDVNYIHDFYLFVLVKLGLVGLALVGAGLAACVGWTWRAASGLAPGPARSFLIAAAAIWIAFALWSVVAPQINSFRIAPVLGLLLAASVRCAEPGSPAASA
ncbi:MAG TPA: hypothetical protein VLW17_14965 [Thermoanaerobaculaceae bacterium]|nr:hypothetical protein [Thermoanaerobaculaceae bacterium]